MSDPPQRPEEPPRRDFLDVVRERTPARIFVGRAGAGYRTETLLGLRRDHAAAVDSVRHELDPGRDLGTELIDRYGLFLVDTRATSKAEYLMRPDLGRSLSEPAIAALDTLCPREATFQVAIGDGLSARAVAAQVPGLLPRLEAAARARGWSFGRPFLVRHCRVGILNDIGDRLAPDVAVLLIGERPGLATSESLSAYMAYRPRAGHTDVHRNLVSNIHRRGLAHDEAAARILDLAEAMLRQRTSGLEIDAEGPGRLTNS